MMYRFEMPLIDPSLRGGKLVRWSKGVGDRIDFGDEICIVAIDEFAAIRRTGRATLLSGRKRAKLKSDVEVRSGKVLVEMAITSADKGILHTILKDLGDQIAIGDTLAIVSADAEDDIGQEQSWTDAPALRVVVNPVDGDEDFEGAS